MKILVCIKQVPTRDAQLRIASSGEWIEGEADLLYEINEPDAYALEEGLRLKEKHKGELVVVCAGPSRVARTLLGALAKGADRAIHIEVEPSRGFDPLAGARLLASAIGPERPDLVLTGLQSDDLGHGQTGVILAELLGLPHASIIMDVEWRKGCVRVKRELEDGWFQHLELPTPALLAVQSGIDKLRYASLAGIKKAKSKEIRRIVAEAPAPTGYSTRITHLSWPRHTRRTQMFGGSPQEAAAELVEKLLFEAKVL